MHIAHTDHDVRKLIKLWSLHVGITFIHKFTPNAHRRRYLPMNDWIYRYTNSSKKKTMTTTTTRLKPTSKMCHSHTSPGLTDRRHIECTKCAFFVCALIFRCISLLHFKWFALNAILNENAQCVRRTSEWIVCVCTENGRFLNRSLARYFFRVVVRVIFFLLLCIVDCCNFVTVFFFFLFRTYFTWSYKIITIVFSKCKWLSVKKNRENERNSEWSILRTSCVFFFVVFFWFVLRVSFFFCLETAFIKMILAFLLGSSYSRHFFLLELICKMISWRYAQPKSTRKKKHQMFDVHCLIRASIIVNATNKNVSEKRKGKRAMRIHTAHYIKAHTQFTCANYEVLIIQACIL